MGICLLAVFPIDRGPINSRLLRLPASQTGCKLTWTDIEKSTLRADVDAVSHLDVFALRIMDFH